MALLVLFYTTTTTGPITEVQIAFVFVLLFWTIIRFVKISVSRIPIQQPLFHPNEHWAVGNFASPLEKTEITPVSCHYRLSREPVGQLRVNYSIFTFRRELINRKRFKTAINITQRYPQYFFRYLFKKKKKKRIFMLFFS